MHEQSVSICGALIYWSGASFSDHQTLLDGFDELGLGAFTPNLCTKEAVLKTSLSRHFDNRMIRPKKDGYGVVEETRNDKNGDNEYKEHYCFWLDGQNKDELRMRPWDYDILTAVALKFNEYSGYVTYNALTDALVKMIGSPRFNGMCGLKPKGGVYWIPAQRLDLWDAVARVVEAAGRIGNNVCFQLKNVMDQDTVKAIHYAVNNEAVAESERLMREVMEDDLGRSALTNRQNEANALLGKLEFYENVLGTSLAALKEAVGRAGEAAAVAALRAGGALIGGAA
jgi:hypothetical protein